MKTVAILGLGYVGFPLAELLCKTRLYRVIGIDINGECVRRARLRLMKKYNFTAAGYFGEIGLADIIIVCVPTPVFKNEKPNYGPLKNASRKIAKFMKRSMLNKTLVIIESTVNPGTCEEVVLPILKKRNAAHFLLAHCPERIDPGNSQWILQNIPRVVGGINTASCKHAASFYRSFLKSEVKEVSTIKVAEASKIVENTFRDINIAYVNELAKSFDKLGIDVVETIEAAKTKPFAFMPHYPGAGIGGHCIPVDPYYLIDRAKKAGFTHEFLKMARKVNKSMPAYTVSLLEKLLQEKFGPRARPIRGKTVGLLGLAYKRDIGDLRESPALEILKTLKQKGARVVTFDPHVPDLSTAKTIHEFFMKCRKGSVILATDHTIFRNLSPRFFQKAAIRAVVDGRNILPKEYLQKSGIFYKGIGR